MKKFLFAVVTFLLWIISTVISFVCGMVGMELINNRMADKAHPKYVRYPNIRYDRGKPKPEETADSRYLTRDYNAKTSKHWSDDPSVNLLFLRNVENHINATLRRRGHVFLNDVYDELGMTRTSHGAIAGWLFTDNTLIAWTPRELKSDENITLEFVYDGIIYNRLVVLD